MQSAMKIASALVLGLALTTAPAVLAHSPEELEAMLGDREKYFQAIDKQAPAFTLENADGESVSLKDLRGKVVVLHFIYASCPDVCPLHSERIAEVQSMVNKTPMKDVVQFISITTDPTNDTPAVMRDYGAAHGLDPVNWVFLTTGKSQSEGATRKLAEAYGHQFKKTKNGLQLHGIVTHVIDKYGRWRANFHGLRFTPTNLVLLINALVNDYHEGAAAGDDSLWRKIRSWF